MKKKLGAVAVAVLAAGAAMASPVKAAGGPLFTDPTGDETLLIGTCVGWADASGTRYPGTCDMGTPVVLDPSIDVTAVDVRADASTFKASLSVVDLDGPSPLGGLTPNRRYEVQVATADGATISAVYVNRPGQFVGGGVLVRGPLGAIAQRDADFFRADPSTNTMSWKLSLAGVNELLAQACPGCAPLASGTVLHDPWAGGQAKEGTASADVIVDFANGGYGRTVVIR